MDGVGSFNTATGVVNRDGSFSAETGVYKRKDKSKVGKQKLSLRPTDITWVLMKDPQGFLSDMVITLQSCI